MTGNAFGKYLKRIRIQNGLTMREFCERHGFDPGNYSRLERGLYPPPTREESLEKYASALNLERGSEGWLELYDLAAASKGQLPKDLIEDDELLEKLPALFRTLRGQPIDSTKLDDFIAHVRRS